MGGASQSGVRGGGGTRNFGLGRCTSEWGIAAFPSTRTFGVVRVGGQRQVV